MRIIAKGKNLAIPVSLRAYAEQKVAKLTRYAPTLDLAEIEFSVEHAKSVVDRMIAQVTLVQAGRILRAEERAGDFRVALERVVDQLQNQIKDGRMRERAHTRGRTPAERFVVAKAGPTGGEYGAVTPPSPIEPEPQIRRHPGAG